MVRFGWLASARARVRAGQDRLPRRHRSLVVVARAADPVVLVDEVGRRAAARADRVGVAAGLLPLPPGAADPVLILLRRVAGHRRLVLLRVAEPPVLPD